MAGEPNYDGNSMIDDFEAWQSSIVGGEHEVNQKLVGGKRADCNSKLPSRWESSSSTGTGM